MATIIFARPLPVTLLYLATVLTSFVSGIADHARPDVISELSTSLSSRAPFERLSSPTVENSSGDAVIGERVSKIIASEGGVMPVPTSSISSTSFISSMPSISSFTSPTFVQYINMKTAIKSGTSKESRVKENMPKERNAAPSVVPRKGVEKKKVKPRKGVNQTSQDLEQTTMSFGQILLKNAKSLVKSVSTTKTVRINNQFDTLDNDIWKLNATDPRSSSSFDLSLSLSPTNITISRTEINSKTILKPLHVEKHVPKPKPIVTTIGREEFNGFRALLRTKSHPLDMPRKIDYIAPVVITVIALPLLGAAIFLLYRHGRDCWDKRHYRRMDFLIDGMYND